MIKAEWTNKDNLSIETTGCNSKAVLVIDMPTDCIKCPLADGFCWNTFPAKGRADGCPLRPLPKRIPTNEYGYMTPYGSVWNACIDKIIGETE